MLSLAWLVVVLPATCMFSTLHILVFLFVFLLTNFVVSEVIALKLRRPGSGREFLYPQIFAGLAYLIASVISLELWRVHRQSAIRKHPSSETAPESDLN